MVASHFIRYTDGSNYKAERALLEAKLSERIQALGDRHAAVAALLTELGWLAHVNGRRRDAQAYLKRAYSICVVADGNAHQDAADCLSALGYIHYSTAITRQRSGSFNALTRSVKGS